jgi:hypothetical protein
MGDDPAGPDYWRAVSNAYERGWAAGPTVSDSALAVADNLEAFGL